MAKLETGPGYDDLNAIQDMIMAMPHDFPLRCRYRELRRALANIEEDIDVALSTTADMLEVEESIRTLRAEVERTVAANRRLTAADFAARPPRRRPAGRFRFPSA